jgi:hypothetical protein
VTVPAVELAALAADRAALGDLTNRIRQLEEGTTMTRNRSGSSPSRSSVARIGTAPGGSATGAARRRTGPLTRPSGVPVAPVVETSTRGGDFAVVSPCPYCGGAHRHAALGQQSSPHRAPGCGLLRSGADRVTGYWLEEVGSDA